MFKVLFALSVAGLLCFMPFYIDFGFKKIPYTLQKMICSTLFLLAGVFAFGACDFPNNWFYRFIIIAFVFSWIGDWALAKKQDLRFIIGLISFLLGHVSYIIAFHYANQMLFGTTPFLIKSEIIAAVLVFLVFLCLKFIIKINFNGMGAAVAVYALTISLMLVKAFSLGIRAFLYLDSAMVLYVVSLAAVSFVISDSVLVLILFKNKSTQITELICITTYYIAQLLFAFSMISLDWIQLGVSCS